MTRVVVTGGSGKVGRACVEDLLGHGYQVVNVDTVPPATPNCPFVQADLTDFGQAMAALSVIDERLDGIDALVHLAAIPAPGRNPTPSSSGSTAVSTYNVFEAARRLGIRNVVWASSETVSAMPFDRPPPYVPVDEEYPGRPETAYSLSKLLGEKMAEQFCRWDPELKIIGLRFSNVMEPEDYARFPGFDADPALAEVQPLGLYRRARRGAGDPACRSKPKIKGAEVFVIANADTVMRRPNAELMAEVFPGVPLKGGARPNGTLLSIDKARRMLGYEPTA